MGEATDRIEQARLRGERPRERTLNFTQILIAVLIAVAGTSFVLGASMITETEANGRFLRQDVYARDYEFTRQQLTEIKVTLNKIAEAVDAKP